MVVYMYNFAFQSADHCRQILDKIRAMMMITGPSRKSVAFSKGIPMDPMRIPCNMTGVTAVGQVNWLVV